MEESRPNSISTSRIRRGLKMLGIIIGSVYVIIVLVLFFAQAALIFPGRSSQGQTEAAVLPSRDRELLEFKTADGARVVAVFGSALSPTGVPLSDAKTRPTLLYFYGNGEYLAASLDKIEAIRRRGLNVMMPDYLGYGLSGGHASEAGCYAAADAAYDALIGRHDIDPNKILLGGFSMGGAVAIDLASRRPCIGLIVSCTFTSLTDMAWREYPYIPVPLLLRHRFENWRKIARIKVPILIANGQLDPIVPTKMADSLAAAAGGAVTRILMKTAEHDDLMRIAQGDQNVSDVLDQFLDRFRNPNANLAQ